MKRFKKKHNKGQAIVEYIIIIVIVAVAALAVMGLLSDTIRSKIAGVISTFDDEKGSEAQSEVDKSSAELFKELDKEGLDNSGGGGD